MAREPSVQRRIADLKRGLKRAAAQAGARSEGTGRGSAHNVNVAGRANVVVAKHVAEDGSSREASSKQTVQIRQHGGETYEEVETTRSAH